MFSTAGSAAQPAAEGVSAVSAAPGASAAGPVVSPAEGAKARLEQTGARKGRISEGEADAGAAAKPAAHPGPGGSLTGCAHPGGSAIGRIWVTLTTPPCLHGRSCSPPPAWLLCRGGCPAGGQAGRSREGRPPALGPHRARHSCWRHAAGERGPLASFPQATPLLDCPCKRQLTCRGQRDVAAAGLPCFAMI